MLCFCYPVYFIMLILDRRGNACQPVNQDVCILKLFQKNIYILKLIILVFLELDLLI
jgi:hypothetical protein